NPELRWRFPLGRPARRPFLASAHETEDHPLVESASMPFRLQHLNDRAISGLSAIHDLARRCRARGFSATTVSLLGGFRAISMLFRSASRISTTGARLGASPRV